MTDRTPTNMSPTRPSLGLPEFARPRSSRGFALVITLSLMVLLTLLAVGLLALSSISLRASSQALAIQEAQANARMALLLALGEVQTYLGPDARMTARAETLGKDPRAGGTAPTGSPEAWWVGVSHTDGKSKLGSANRSIVWLVSGANDTAPAEGLPDPIRIIDAGSLDLTVTGGRPIQAGRVAIHNSTKQTTGAYAWFVDDEGMKAQLAVAHPEVRNDNPKNPSGGVLPASYKPDILMDLGVLTATPDADILRLGSTRELELVGLSKAATRSKFFSYTTRSRGVLADPKNGGLKKDLTIAFENSTVFSKVFPVGDPGKYLLIAPTKRSSELASNGYIHWAIFRDYYNLKKSLRELQGIDTLDINTFNKDPFLAGSTPMTRGLLGPHAMNESELPYGQPVVYGGAAYVNNPIFPVLAHLQQNSWVDYTPAAGGQATLKTNAQLWTSHYNPYNVGIHVYNDAGTGPRVMHFPMVLVSVGDAFTRTDALNRKLQVHAPVDLVIPPGRSQVLGFSANRAVGQENDDLLYSEKVKDLTFESVQGTFTLKGALPGSVAVTTEFFSNQAAMLVGCDHKGGSLEAGQVFFTPFAWDRIPAGGGSLAGVASSTPAANIAGVSQDRPGKKFTQTLSAGQLNRNSMVSHAFSLRTTRQSNARLRPLVDANVRAQWNNPRWDSPLGLNVVATHSMDDSGAAEDKFVPMSTATPPYGFSYLGAGRSPSDGVDRVILFDVPRRDLVSLGQLQHAAAGRFSYEPSYIVGNSYANPRIPLTDWKTSTSDTYSTAARGLADLKITGNFSLYDASYLVNEVLWDSYTFTTLPQQNDNYRGGDVAADYPALLQRTTQLPNPRFIPYEPSGSKFNATNLKQAGTATTGAFFHNAGHLLVDGAFNVNSTSVDAWEAFLSGTHRLPVAKINTAGRITGYTAAKNVRFPRCANTFGVGMTTAAINDNYWTGFRELTPEDVRQIAEKIVAENQARGASLTLGAFVNRRLTNDDTGRSGPLQAALDKTVNKSLDKAFEEAADSSRISNIPAASTQGAGFPGQLLQGDVLQALGPFMTVRSDTFTIRAYGEARNPVTGAITASAWCEAVVERRPEPVPSSTTAKSVLEELTLPSSPFGRQFTILSFRWLSPLEV